MSMKKFVTLWGCNTAEIGKYIRGMPIRKVMDIPGEKAIRRLLETDPGEGERVYRESMRVLDRSSTKISVAAIVISILSFLLSAI